jgi:hypothetical protein
VFEYYDAGFVPESVIAMSRSVALLSDAGLLFVDLNICKSINESHGSAFGSTAYSPDPRGAVLLSRSMA